MRIYRKSHPGQAKKLREEGQFRRQQRKIANRQERILSEQATLHDANLLAQVNSDNDIPKFQTQEGFNTALAQLFTQQLQGMQSKALHTMSEQSIYKSSALSTLNKLLKSNTDYLNSENLFQIYKHTSSLQTRRGTSFTAEHFLDLLGILDDALDQDDRYKSLSNKALMAMVMLLGNTPMGSIAIAQEELTLSTRIPERLAAKLDSQDSILLTEILYGFVSAKQLLDARREFQDLASQTVRLVKKADLSPRLVIAVSRFINQHPEYIEPRDIQSMIKRGLAVQDLDASIALAQLALHANDCRIEIHQPILNQAPSDFYQYRLHSLNSYLNLVMKLLVANADPELITKHLQKIKQIVSSLNGSSYTIDEDANAIALQILQGLSVINHLAAKQDLKMPLAIPRRIIDAGKKAIRSNIHSRSESMVSNTIRELLEAQAVYIRIESPDIEESVTSFGGLVTDRIILHRDRRFCLEVDGAAHWDRKAIPDWLRDQFFQEEAGMPVIRISVPNPNDKEFKAIIEKQLPALIELLNA